MTATSNRLLASGALLALGLVLSACPSTPPGGGGQDSGCDGQLNCACVGGTTCSAGECVGGTCTDCRRGDEACLCRSNGTCNAGLMCANQLCVTCPKGAQNCPCNTGDTCNTGLSCTAGTCTPSSCTAGAASCPCRGSDPKCDGTAYCDTSSVCQTCSADVAGCPCGSGNTCGGGLVCDSTSTKCRAAVTCAMQKANGTCKAHQTCNDATGADGVCVNGSCETDFKWDGTTMSCVACVSPGCTAEPTCANGDGGIGDSCDAANRLCSQAGNVASCGACKLGFQENAQKVCVPAAVCNGVTCALTDYCDTTGAVPTCKMLPCPAGQAKTSLIDGGAGACQTCSPSPNCNAEGFSGRVWPFMTLGDQCICETVSNYFLPSGNNGQATKCDADKDGWVHEDADKNITDPAVLANSRCAIRRAASVRLVDEFGTALELTSCKAGGMLPKLADGGAPCSGTGILPLRLLETERNDVPGKANTVSRAPPYGAGDGGVDGGVGRLLEASELNSLTKACVATVADYNGNGVDDIAEAAPVPPVGTPDDRVRLESFAYFMELHTSYFVAPDAGTLGTLVIAERSRCGSDFPLHYDPAVNARAPNDLYRADAGLTYWRNCGRNRDPNYDQATPLPNLDFAQWDCAATNGTCPYTPPAHPNEIAPVDPASKLLRNFGVCEMNGASPKDGVWRGMMHHSQFKCVNVTATPAANGYDRLTADLGSSGTLVLNQCGARVCSSPTDPGCRTQQGAGAQTSRPVVDCKPVIPAVAGSVGFAAVKFQGYGSGYSGPNYLGGCVSEDFETKALAPLNTAYQSWLCPYPEYNSMFSAPANQKPKVDSSFGRFSCYGDLPNFLWAPPTERATLRWAGSAADTTNGYLR
ncbi:MAG: hypothetical protein K1X89_03360 [Myxococcaceae bacterium]|nr:hypothetical protein [Myxococcaceae bacterium]